MYKRQVLTPEIAAGILTAVKEEYRMICGMTYFQICLYFLFYSFGGWVVDVIFHAVTLGKVINRGFLTGPVCPVYGFGVLSVFALLNTLQSGGHQRSEGTVSYTHLDVYKRQVLALDNKKMKINEWPRHGIQALWAALTNSHISDVYKRQFVLWEDISNFRNLDLLKYGSRWKWKRLIT